MSTLEKIFEEDRMKKEYLSDEIQEINDAVELELLKDELTDEELEQLTDEELDQLDKEAEQLLLGKPTDFNVKDFNKSITDKADEKAWGDHFNDDYGPLYSGKATNGKVSAYSPPCTHKPVLVIKDEGIEIYVGRKYDCLDHLEDFPLVMNMTGQTVTSEHIIPIPSMQKWAKFTSFKEILLDWPDFGVVKFPLEFWQDLIKAVKENGGKLLIFCQGGHGRTGTAFACLLVAMGYTSEQAMTLVWNNYCKQAIESKSQELYIHSIGAQYEQYLAKKPKKGKKNAKLSVV
jgi:hypothetical protein